MKQLHCEICKFTLSVGDAAEAAAYKAHLPRHCAQPMVPDGEAPEATPAPVPEEAPKEEEKKGFFGGKKKKK